MSVFLLVLVGPATLETSLLSLGFVDFFFFSSFTTSPSTLHLHIFSFFFSAPYLANLT